MAQIKRRAEVQEVTAANYRGASPSQAVMPDLATRTEAAPLPSVQPRHQFILGWNLACWMVMDGKLLWRTPGELIGLAEDRISGVSARANGEFSTKLFTMSDADLMRLEPRDQACTSGGTSPLVVKLSESQSTTRQRINVWGFDLAAIASQV